MSLRNGKITIYLFWVGKVIFATNYTNLHELQTTELVKIRVIRG